MKRVRDIFYIDDEPEDLKAAARALGLEGRIDHHDPANPADTTAPQAAAQANVWVFDFYNSPEQRDSPSLSGVGSNGLSLFQQFRLMVEDERPPTVLASNDLEAALGSAILAKRRHVLAEQVGVEWIVAKADRSYIPIQEIASLADATARLQPLQDQLAAAGASEYARELSALALRLPHRPPWSLAAVRGVAEWRPPIGLAAGEGHKSAVSRSNLTLRPGLRSARDVVSWMVRRVLPYPSFLIRERHIAVRLGVTLRCLKLALAAETGIAKRLGQMRYRGILDDFDGHRWWAAGVDSLDWELPRGGTDRHGALEKLFAPIVVRSLKLVDPVLVSDPDLIETDIIASVSDCVRASDEYFPPQSPYAWVKIQDAKQDQALARKVRQEDQDDLMQHAEPA